MFTIRFFKCTYSLWLIVNILATLAYKSQRANWKTDKRSPRKSKHDELIGVLTARNAFATLSLERSMSAEEVITITGHKDYQSFKRYVKVTEQLKKVVMLKAWGDITNLKLKVI